MKDVKFVCGDISFGTYNPPESHWRKLCKTPQERKAWETIFNNVARIDHLKCFVYIKLIDEQSADIEMIKESIRESGMKFMNHRNFNPGLIMHLPDLGEGIWEKINGMVTVNYEDVPIENRLELSKGVVRIILGDVNRGEQVELANACAVLLIEPFDMDEIEMFDLSMGLAEKLNGCALPYEDPIFADDETTRLATAKIQLRYYEEKVVRVR